MGPWLCRAPADPCKADVPGICVSVFIYISCTEIAAAALAQLWHTQGALNALGGDQSSPASPKTVFLLRALLGTADFGTWSPSDFQQADVVCLEFVKGANVWGEFLP